MSKGLAGERSRGRGGGSRVEMQVAKAAREEVLTMLVLDTGGGDDL